MKVLVLRFSAIGDIILTTPVVRCLKQQRPDTIIHYATQLQYAFLVQHNPYVDQVFTWEKGNKASLPLLIEQLIAEQYDYVIDLHHNLRTAKIKRALAKPAFSFDKLNIQKWLYVNLKWDRMPDIHIVDRYMLTVSQFGIVNDNKGLDYYFNASEALPTIPWPLPEGSPWPTKYVAVGIGATHFTKQLPIIRLIELCQQAYIRYHLPIVILGGPTDAQRGAVLAEAMTVAQIPHYDSCGLLTFDQSALVIKLAQLVFSNDTGLMHVAAAFKKPTVSIWGNTTPRLGMYPYQTPFVIWQHSLGLSCRPCSKIGFSKCPKGHFKCMMDLPFDWKAVDQLMEETA